MLFASFCLISILTSGNGIKPYKINLWHVFFPCPLPEHITYALLLHLFAGKRQISEEIDHCDKDIPEQPLSASSVLTRCVDGSNVLSPITKEDGCATTSLPGG